jgi:hypothetical protein
MTRKSIERIRFNNKETGLRGVQTTYYDTGGRLSGISVSKNKYKRHNKRK